MDGPIVISPSIIQSMLAVLFRQGGLVVGAIATLLALFQAGDINAIRDYLLSSGFLVVMTTVWGAGSLAYGQYKAFKDKRLKIVLANMISDDLVVVGKKGSV